VLSPIAKVNDTVDFDSQRLARLLALPKVSKYSRLSMAPTSTGRPRLSARYDVPTVRSFKKRRPLEHGGTGQSMASSNLSTMPVLKRSLEYRAPPGRVAQAVAGKYNGPPAPARSESLPIVQGHQLAKRITNQTLKAPPSRRPVVAQGDPAGGPLPPEESSDERRRSRRIGKVVPDTPMAPRARNPRVDQPDSSHASTEYPDPNLAGRWTEGMAGSHSLEPSSPTRAVDHPDRPTGVHSDAAADRRTLGQTGAATVHLDGSALGRWAIQHLERSLSKPANGMTGVDPRAGAPRGRVSPF
jgi:hypothetical protein